MRLRRNCNYLQLTFTRLSRRKLFMSRCACAVSVRQTGKESFSSPYIQDSYTGPYLHSPPLAFVIERGAMAPGWLSLSQDQSPVQIRFSEIWKICTVRAALASDYINSKEREGKLCNSESVHENRPFLRKFYLIVYVTYSSLQLFLRQFFFQNQHFPTHAFYVFPLQENNNLDPFQCNEIPNQILEQNKDISGRTEEIQIKDTVQLIGSHHSTLNILVLIN